MIGDLFDKIEDDDDPGNLFDYRAFCFAAKKTNDPDHPLLHEALAGPDRDKYLEGMEKEVRKLEEKGTWKIVEKSALKPGSNILQGTWALRRKRLPDGTISSYKARFCVRGDQQVEGVDYFDTYAPVVSWSTVRLLLTLAILKGWKTRQVDYTNAFVQANLKENENVYVALPKCFILSGRTEVVLKLIKSLYGLKQAPLRWFERLRDGLLKRGFVQSRLDPCLFYKRGLILLIYVDDCLFFGSEGDLIDKEIQDLEKEFNLRDEGDVGAFLGINISRLKDGRFQLSTYAALPHRKGSTPTGIRRQQEWKNSRKCENFGNRRKWTTSGRKLGLCDCYWNAYVSGFQLKT